jgi:hypothetical protein
VNQFNDAPANQDARTWSGRLGSLAADLPATRPAVDPNPALDAPTRLSAILPHFRQRRQDALLMLRANEFVKETCY